MVIPGNFGQFAMRCELCHTPFKYKIKHLEKNNSVWNSLFCDITKYFTSITTILLISYIGMSYFLKACGKPNIFTNWHIDTEPFQNQLLNGFLFVHLILGLFYITMLSVLLCSNNENHICCFFVGWEVGNHTGNHNIEDDCTECDENYYCDVHCIIIFIIIGILGTILVIYYDVLYRLTIRNSNNQKEILEFADYLETIHEISIEK
jgi:hypothetical protein